MFKKYIAIVLGALVLVNQPVRSAAPVAPDMKDVKEAIKTASDKAFWGWAKSRTVPLAAGAAMFAAPPVIGTVGFMGILGNSGTGLSKGQSERFAAMLAFGVIGCTVLMPLGKLLIDRQISLIDRDQKLLNDFTKSTSHLETRSLPSVYTIAKMDNHHQLLSAAKLYFDKEGNAQEKRLLSTLGFRGYKFVQP